MLNRNRVRLVIGVGLLCMGIAVPSCPGQKEVQDRVDALQMQHTELMKKVGSLSASVTSLTKDMNDVKQVLPQITAVIQAQKNALEQVSSDVKGLSKKKKR